MEDVAPSEHFFKDVISKHHNQHSTEASGNFDFMNYLVRTKLGLVTIVFLSTLLTSFAMEPPFLMIKNKDPIKSDELSYSRALVVSTLISGAVFAVPMVTAS